MNSRAVNEQSGCWRGGGKIAFSKVMRSSGVTDEENARRIDSTNDSRDRWILVFEFFPSAPSNERKKKNKKKNEKAYDPPRAGNIFPRVLAKQGDFLSLGYKRRGERESFRDGRIENSYKTFLNIYEISDIYIGN